MPHCRLAIYGCAASSEKTRALISFSGNLLLLISEYGIETLWKDWREGLLKIIIGRADAIISRST